MRPGGRGDEIRTLRPPVIMFAELLSSIELERALALRDDLLRDSVTALIGVRGRQCRGQGSQDRIVHLHGRISIGGPP